MEKKPLNNKMTERTNEALWQRIKNEVQRGSKGGNPNQWSARKAQLAVLKYKQAGGRYKGPKSPNNSLSRWTSQHWRTKSGRRSLDTGERYLPEKDILKLSDREYAATTRAKRRDMRRGIQFSRQPREVLNKLKR
jgi:hypothetical protein